jgi:hypothetical protein
MFKYTACILSRNLNDQFESITVPVNMPLLDNYRRQGNQQAANLLIRRNQEGLQEFKNFWKNANEENAKFVWDAASEDGNYSFIWNMSKNRENKLVAEIFKIAIKEDRKDFFTCENGLEALKICAIQFNYNSEELRKLCSRLIEHSNIVSEVIANCDMVNDSNIIYLVLQLSKDDELIESLEKKLNLIDEAGWELSFKNDTDLTNIAIYLHKQNPSLLLENEFLNSFVGFIKSWLKDEIDPTDWQKGNYKNLVDLFGDDFKKHFAIRIGKLLAENKFAGNPLAVEYIRSNADFKEVVITDKNMIQDVISDAAEAGNPKKLVLIDSILCSVKETKLIPDRQYSSVLRKPLEKLLNSCENQEEKDAIKRIAIIFKIDLSSEK